MQKKISTKQHKPHSRESVKSDSLATGTPLGLGFQAGLWGKERAGPHGNFLVGFILKQRFGSPGPVSLARQCLFEKSHKHQEGGKWPSRELVSVEPSPSSAHLWPAE